MSEEFYDAVCKNDLQAVAAILANDPALSNFQFDGDTHPLHQCAYGNFKEVAELLIRHGADVNGLSYDSMTPIHEAARTHAIEVARVLIANGAALANRDVHGYTPAVTALREHSNDCDEFARFLFDVGAPIELYEAICLNDVDRCREVIARDGDKAFDGFDHDGLLLDTIVNHRGSAQAKKEIVRMLFDNGLQPSEYELKRATEWSAGRKDRCGDLGEYLAAKQKQTPVEQDPPTSGPHWRFELADRTSKVFWEIGRSNTSVTEHFGKIGSPGEIKRHELATQDAAKVRLKELVNEKLAEGYKKVR